MNIQNVTTGLNPTNPAKQISPPETDETQSGTPASGTGVRSLPPQRDRVDLSHAVPGKDLTPEQGRELAFARQALHSLPGLNQERLDKIRSRVESGDYTRPEFIKELADRIAGALRDEMPPDSDLGVE